MRERRGDGIPDHWATPAAGPRLRGGAERVTGTGTCPKSGGVVGPCGGSSPGTDDRERCRAAKVPDERGFATKGELAERLVLRALASDLPLAWVAADVAYGQKGRFRRFLAPRLAGNRRVGQPLRPHHPMCRTGVPGLYAAGDAATSVPPSMVSAMASGYLAGAAAAVQLTAGY
ncbi:transposase [Streptomyces shenzhenensis]